MPLTPEEMERLEAGVLEPPSTEPTPNSIDEIELDELGLLSEEIAVLSIVTEEKFEEVLECLKKLENSSQQTENPVQQSMVTDLANLKTEIAELKGMVTALHASLTALNLGTHRDQQPNESLTENPPMENPSEQNQERSTEEPKPEETLPERRKHKIL